MKELAEGVTLIAHGTANELQAVVDARWPLGPFMYEWARQRVTRSPLEGMPYQYCALYGLAQQFDGGHLLEIGVGLGFSAAMFAQGAPNGSVVSVDICAEFVERARASLADFPNATVRLGDSRSEETWADLPGPFDLLFVDGDHGPEMVKDLTWYNKLRVGGLMLVHDFDLVSPEHFPPVVLGVKAFMQSIGRTQPDVALIEAWGNKGPRGMVGFYRREGEEFHV